PIAVYRRQQRLNARFLANLFIETLMPILSGRGTHSTPELNDVSLGIPLAAELAYSVFTCRLADHDVIAADELGVFICVDVPIENDYWNFCINSFQDHSG